MTYKNHFIAELKSNGQILRIRDGFVTLPFGSEYSLYLKNLNSRKALVNIQIDGVDVLDGNSLVIEPNNTSEIEGFLKNTIAKNKFKFIKKTKEISEHRGDRIDDGIIRIEFAFEKENIIRNIINEHHIYYSSIQTPRSIENNFYGTAQPRGVLDQTTFTSNNTNELFGAVNCNVRDVSEVGNLGEIDQLKTPIDDLGITVKGSEINQQFGYVNIGETDPSEVIIIQLRGTNSKGTFVKKPMMVQKKLVCSSCGLKNSSLHKFCSNCGTFLE